MKSSRFTESRSITVLKQSCASLLALVSISLLLPGCGLIATEPREFAVAVDSISTPAQVRADSAFTIKLWGPIGPSGCYRFARAQVNRDMSRATIVVVAEETRGEWCTAMPVWLQGEPVILEPPFRDPFEVRVQQPDGLWLARTVSVTP